MIQTSQFKFDERLFSEIYFCRLCLKHRREIQKFLSGGRKFQKDAAVKDMLLLLLVLNKREDFAVVIFMMKASREGLRSVSGLRICHYQSFKIHEEKMKLSDVSMTGVLSVGLAVGSSCGSYHIISDYGS